MSLETLIVHTAALLTPSAMRGEWLAEWLAELAAVRRRRPKDSLAFARGAFADAWWLRRNSPVSERFLDSPLRCLGLLAVLAAISVLGARPQLSGANAAGALRSVPLYALFTGMALLILPSSTPLSLGDYSAGGRQVPWWSFLAAKIVLVLAIVFFATTALIGTPVANLRPHAIIPGSMIAFRWLLADQRRRCPVCLRRLRHPAGIGSASHTFLEWYGTELACPRGHGLLHVSEIGSADCYQPQRWLPLDASWRGLFVRGRRSAAQGPA